MAREETRRVTGMRGTLLLLMLGAALAAAGCGRKNLPVAPSGATVPIGTEEDPDSPRGSAGLTGTQTFQRAARLSQPGDLTVSPAQVSRNPAAKKKSFVLDPLLN